MPATQANAIIAVIANVLNWHEIKHYCSLPYRMVFAVATLDSVLLYDTQQTAPFGFVGSIHYAALTDVTWYIN